MRDLIIDPEFKFLLPELDKKTLALLEENLLEHGIRDPIVVWNDTIIDGHNRYALATKHDLPFTTVNKEFDTRDEVLIWIINTQVSRRNLSPTYMSYFRGLHYSVDKRIIRNKSGKNQYTEVFPQNEGKPKERSTAGRLSDHYKVSIATIERDAKAADAIDAIGRISPDAKARILSGDVRLNKNQLRVLSAGPQEDITDVAARIEEGTYERKRSVLAVSTIPAVEEGTGAALAGKSEDHFAPDSMKILPFGTAIGRITDELFSELRKQAEHENAEFKTALRSYISMLEDLYSQM